MSSPCLLPPCIRPGQSSPNFVLSPRNCTSDCCQTNDTSRIYTDIRECESNQTCTVTVTKSLVTQ